MMDEFEVQSYHIMMDEVQSYCIMMDEVQSYCIMMDEIQSYCIFSFRCAWQCNKCENLFVCLLLWRMYSHLCLIGAELAQHNYQVSLSKTLMKLNRMYTVPGNNNISKYTHTHTHTHTLIYS